MLGDSGAGLQRDRVLGGGWGLLHQILSSPQLNQHVLPRACPRGATASRWEGFSGGRVLGSCNTQPPLETVSAEKDHAVCYWACFH